VVPLLIRGAAAVGERDGKSSPEYRNLTSLSVSRRLLASGEPERLGEVREAMAEVAEQMVRAGQIVRRLRDFITRGETEKQIESVTAMVEEASVLAVVGTNATGVDIHFSFDPDSSLALVIRIQIQQVLTNLIRNAIEAMAGCIFVDDDAAIRRSLERLLDSASLIAVSYETPLAFLAAVSRVGAQIAGVGSKNRREHQ
jgi:C4-dicarboxylate-specific signal transduction histidine kinase